MADQLQDFPELEHLDARLHRLASFGAAHSAAPEAAFVRQRAVASLRRRRAGVALVVAAAACILGVVAFGVPSLLGGDAVVPAPPVHQPTTLPSTPARVDRVVSVGTVMNLTLPTGWTATINSGLAAPSGTDYYCFEPVTAKGSGCAGVTVIAGRYLPGNEGTRHQPNQVAGWYTGTDVMPCPVGRPSTGSYLNGVNPGGAPVTEELRPIGTHTAYYDKWRATCADGSVFFPQAWYLPYSKVLIKTTVAVPGVNALLKSATLARDGVPMMSVTGSSGRLEAATPGGVRVTTAGAERTLRVTTRTACLAGPKVEPSATDGRVLVGCDAFVTWLTRHPGRSLAVDWYADPSGDLAQLAER